MKGLSTAQERGTTIPRKSINTASPLSTALLALSLLAFSGYFRHAAKMPAAMPTLGTQADAKMSVIFHCRLGDAYETVERLCQGAATQATKHANFDRSELSVTWPSDNHRFVGSFKNGKLVWATEQVSIVGNDKQIKGTRTCFLNAANPSNPSAITTMADAARL